MKILIKEKKEVKFLVLVKSSIIYEVKVKTQL